MSKKTELFHHHIRTDDQRIRMNQAENDELCPFCPEGLVKIHRMPILHALNLLFVTESAFPYEGTSAHYMIIPKRHLTEVEQLTAEDWEEIGLLFAWIREHYSIQYGGMFIRFGDMSRTGSSVAHLHFQILSGTKKYDDENREPLRVKLGYK